ncbi:MAG: deoxyribose-phosphate aldolase [Acholeplasmataceae bacterium]
MNKLIDHTKLGNNVTLKDIEGLVNEANTHKFMSVCVDPIYVAYAKSLVKDVLVCTVVGFPHGTQKTSVKVLETKEAILDGADEIDMVLNQNALKNKDYPYVLEEIKAIKKACGNHVLKVIIETSNLSEAEKIKACELAKEAGADFVKTSTGFHKGGATLEDVALMRRVVGPKMGVKASGGVRTYDDAKKMVIAGATRIGTSNGLSIINKEKNNDSNTSY